MNFATKSGDHRNGPIAVPGEQESPYGCRYLPGDPEPWPGFAGLLDQNDYVFLHNTPTDVPTTSTGYGGYYYWKKTMIFGRECYVDIREEIGSYDEEIRTIHLAPVAPVTNGRSSMFQVHQTNDRITISGSIVIHSRWMTKPETHSASQALCSLPIELYDAGFDYDGDAIAKHKDSLGKIFEGGDIQIYCKTPEAMAKAMEIVKKHIK